MQVYHIFNKPVDSTCWVVVGDVDKKCIVIDPGTEDCRELLALLDEHQLKVQYIFLTHEHIDHIIGCKVLKERYDCQLICSDACAENLNNTRFNLSRLAEYFTPRDKFPLPDITYTDVLTLCWNGTKVVLSKLLGHSLGSSLVQIGKCLFVGDTFIHGFKTTTTLPGSSKPDLVKSFERLLNDFTDDEIVVYPGHFDTCSLQEMKREILPQLEKTKEIVKRKGL